MTRLSGKVALVTGAAQGMGAAHARAIVDDGGSVVLADIGDEAGRQLAASLGQRARYVHLDVTSATDWSAAVTVAVDTFGALNVLVNNAGIINWGAVGEYTHQQWNDILAVNLTGAYLGIEAARDALIASAPSSVINISSTSGFEGVPGMHGYVASKWGLRGLTKSLALELGAFGIRVNSVHPGTIATPMTTGMGVTGDHGALHRLGEPAEVASMVTYLASDESGYCTGSEFVVDGGQLAGQTG